MEEGDYYHSSADLRRFVTVDYNTYKYIGIVGDGVISGWELSFVPGSKVVNITPGFGFSDGLLCETPFVKTNDTGLPKRVSQVNLASETIYEYIPGYSDPRPES
jgi:hypothetical protein